MVPTIFWYLRTLIDGSDGEEGCWLFITELYKKKYAPTIFFNRKNSYTSKE